MKVAILISGYLRSFKSNYENLQKNIFDKFDDFDVYMHITENEILDDRYFNHIEDINTIKQKLKPKCLLIEPNSKLSDDKIRNNVLNSFLKFYKLNQLKKINESTQGCYDLVIKYRPDLKIKSNINFDLDYQSIKIPKDSKIDKNSLNRPDDKYICNTFAFGCSELMDKYFDIWRFTEKLFQKFGNVPETLLYEYLVQNDIDFRLFDLDYEVVLSECNVFAICGDSGSGKTRLGNRLKQFFSDSFMLECDRYHKWERGDDNWSNYTHLNPSANYISKMNEDIFNLKVGNSIYQVDYDHKVGKFTEQSLIDPSENTIVCGLHSLYNDDNVYNLKIFIDTDNRLKEKWKIERDVNERGHSLEYVLKQIQNRKDDYIRFIEPQKEKADLIINFYEYDNNLSLRILVSKKFNLKKILKFFDNKKIDYQMNDVVFDNFNSVNFYTYIQCNLWEDECRPTFNDFYDYIIFFILKLK